MPDPILMTAFDLAERWVGVKELPGKGRSNPFILGMLQLDQSWPADDEVAWCSAFVNFICWQLRLTRSKNLAARSWLGVGQVLAADQAQVGFDLVILRQPGGPGADVQKGAPGHVGFFAGHHDSAVWILGGNQGNAVTVARFDPDLVIGYRRVRRTA